jgi:hypothetical protein
LPGLLQVRLAPVVTIGQLSADNFHRVWVRGVAASTYRHPTPQRRPCENPRLPILER